MIAHSQWPPPPPPKCLPDLQTLRWGRTEGCERLHAHRINSCLWNKEESLWRSGEDGVQGVEQRSDELEEIREGGRKGHAGRGQAKHGVGVGRAEKVDEEQAA